MNGNRLSGILGNEDRGRELGQRGAWIVVACPALWQQELYRAAYERAVAITAPWPPRQLAVPCLN
jgi:hypothetical protein